MGVFSYITPTIYLLLVLLWGYALLFCASRLASRRHDDRLNRILLAVVGVVALAFVVESVYFGVRFSSQSGLLPAWLNATLERPELTLLPKLFNVLAASTTGFILLRVWLPRADAERREARDVAAKTQREYADLVESLDAIVWEGNAETFSFTYVSPQAERILGYPVTDWYNDNFWVDHIHPEDRAGAATHCVEATAAGEDHRFEYRMIASDGREVWIQDSATVLPAEPGRNRVLRGILVDVTERHAVEATRQAYLERLQAQSRVLVQLATDPAIVGADLEAGLRAITRCAARTLDLKRVGVWLLSPDGTELTAASIYYPATDSHEQGEVIRADQFPHYFGVVKEARFIDAEDLRRDPRTAEFAAYADNYGVGAAIDAPIRIQGRLVGVVWHEHAEPRTWHADETVFAGSMADQVAQLMVAAERRAAEEAMQRLYAAIEQAGEAVVITDTAGRIEYVNPIYEVVTGLSRERMLGTTLSLFTGSDGPEGSALRDALAHGQAWRGRIRHGRDNGDTHLQEVTVSPVTGRNGVLTNFVFVLLDVTYQFELEERLRRAQRLEAVGRLASGIAHDFNNILQAILGHLDLAQVSPGDSAELAEHLVGAQLAAKRASGLTRQLLAFGRKQELQQQDVALNEVIGAVLDMIRRVIGEAHVLTYHPDPAAGVVHADPGQLEQVLLNLCINARDAMPDGGEIVIETSSVVLDASDLAARGAAQPGTYCLLRVTDAGCGMSPETLEKALEPFFSTKPESHGTGLGLAMVYGIIKQHGGFVNLYSEEGKGTSVHVGLPRSANELAPTAAVPAESPAGGGAETVLVADDNDLVRRVTVAILRAAGYTLLEARDGQEAVELVEQHNGAIDLVVMDVIMPRLNGREAYHRICERSAVPVLFTSGYSGNAMHTRFVEESGAHILEKPFRRDALLAAVRRELDR